MRKMIEYVLTNTLKIVLKLRYRVRVVGLDKLAKYPQKKNSGWLFLTNHPTVFLDPLISGLAVFSKYPIRPMIIDYMYHAAFINPIARFLKALPMPNFYESSNSLKKKQAEEVIQEICLGLMRGENFMIAPAGRVKISPLEKIGANSSVQRILQDFPAVNVAFLRTTGLYGSSFSTVQTGSSPSIARTIGSGIKDILKNLIFFTPRREVTVEIEPAPQSFPYSGSRLEINQYLENWYNRPDGLTKQRGEYPGESMVLVSYSMWKDKFLSVDSFKPSTESDEIIELSSIPDDVKQKISMKISALANKEAAEIKEEMSLANDLGLDSLDGAELALYLQQEFDLSNIAVNELTTVKKVMALAARQIKCQLSPVDSAEQVTKEWYKKSTFTPTLPTGETIPEMFLHNCARMGKAIACADDVSGVVTYPQLKLRILILAGYIQKLPGEYIGFLLPSSVAANAITIAIQLAGKIPVPVNWTVGPRHLETVLKLSGLTTILTSKAFLDRLEHVDLGPIGGQLVMLEDVRKQFSVFEKLKAFYYSKLPPSAVLRAFKARHLTAQSTAVLLFTSGTENMPKGVPLTYQNVLSNLNAALSVVNISAPDILFGILPPFHSFGFTIGGVFALIAGLRVAYSPNPTDGKKMAKDFEKWAITILVGPPTFIKGLINHATPGQLETLRLCVSGAEKAPTELFQMIEGLGAQIVEGYGITECSPVLTMNPIGKKHKGVGLAFPGVALKIVHPETFQPLPKNTQGLILAQGSSIFNGYLNKDVATPFLECTDGRWYKTGDLGFLDEEGYLTLSGRLKRFVKIGGEMVSLGAIEDAILSVCAVKNWHLQQDGPTLAICAKELAGEKTKIHLFTRFKATLEEVNQVLKEAGFSNLLRLSSVICVPEIPILGTGKVNYRALESSYLS